MRRRVGQKQRIAGLKKNIENDGKQSNPEVDKINTLLLFGSIDEVTRFPENVSGNRANLTVRNSAPT